MSLVARCARCAKEFAAPEKLAGKKVACPQCGAVISVPGSQLAAPAPPPPPAAVRPPAAVKPPTPVNPPRPAAPAATGIPVRCRQCSHSFSAPERFAGKRVACPKCSAAIQIPAPAVEEPVLEILDDDPFDDLDVLDVAPVSAPVRKPLGLPAKPLGVPTKPLGPPAKPLGLPAVRPNPLMGGGLRPTSSTVKSSGPGTAEIFAAGGLGAGRFLFSHKLVVLILCSAVFQLMIGIWSNYILFSLWTAVVGVGLAMQGLGDNADDPDEDGNKLAIYVMLSGAAGVVNILLTTQNIAIGVAGCFVFAVFLLIWYAILKLISNGVGFFRTAGWSYTIFQGILPALGLWILFSLGFGDAIALKNKFDEGFDPAGFSSVPVPPIPERPPTRHMDHLMDVVEVTFDLPGQPGDDSRVCVYLPPGAHGRGSLPGLFLAAGGADGLVGMKVSPTHLALIRPFVRAGYAVIAYDLDGAVPPGKTELQAIKYALAFRNAYAGLVNGRNALACVRERFPEIDTDRLFCAGSDTGGSACLLLAEYEPSLKGCVAWSPLSDMGELGKAGNVQLKGAERDLFIKYSTEMTPSAHVDLLKCPVFIYQPQDDAPVLVQTTNTFAQRALAGGRSVEVKRVPKGLGPRTVSPHGIAAALEWLAPRSKAMAAPESEQPPAATAAPLAERQKLDNGLMDAMRAQPEASDSTYQELVELHRDWLATTRQLNNTLVAITSESKAASAVDTLRALNTRLQANAEKRREWKDRGRAEWKLRNNRQWVADEERFKTEYEAERRAAVTQLGSTLIQIRSNQSDAVWNLVQPLLPSDSEFNEAVEAAIALSSKDSGTNEVGSSRPRSGRSSAPANRPPELDKVRSHTIRTDNDGQRFVVPGEPLDDDREVKFGDELQALHYSGNWVIVQAGEVQDAGQLRVWYLDKPYNQSAELPRRRLRVPPDEPERQKPADAIRIWADRDGKLVKAKFLNANGGTVRLRTDAGKLVPVPFDTLSEDDQLAVRRFVKAQENEAAQEDPAKPKSKAKRVR